MRVLVTGSRGFTGRYLVAALERRGDEPIALGVDITHASDLSAAIEAIRPDRVIHLAALAFVQSDDFASFYAVNQVGTFNLLDAVAKAAPGTPVLLASSANIYGNRASGFIDETARPDPVNHYGLSKWAMEEGARLWADRLPITIARPFNYTGRGQEDRYLIPKIVGHFIRREPVIELGNIDVQRDFSDVRSVVDAYVGLNSTDTHGTFNICSSAVYSIADIIRMASDITGHSIEVAVNPAFVRSNDVAILAGVNDRLRKVLPEWRPHALQETLAWMLAA